MANTAKQLDADEAPKTLHEINEAGREDTRLMTIKNNHLFKWAQKNRAVSEGRVGKLVSKVEGGTLRPDAFKSAVELMKEPSNREDTEHKKLIDHLLKGEFSNFGENFRTIADAFESKDNEIKQLAAAFVHQEDIQGERAFLKKLAALKKSRVNPLDLINKTKGALTMAGLSEETGNRPHEEKAVEVVERGDLGFLPPPPERAAAEYPQLTQKVTTYVSESTQKLKSITDLVNQSRDLADTKTALRTRIESDPKYAQEFLQKLVEDYELLKRSATLMSEMEGNPELLEAIKQMDLERKEYFTLNRQSPSSPEDSPHKIFLRATESKGAREALLAAAKKNIDRLLDKSIESDMERTVDDVVFEAEKLNRKPTALEFQKAISQLKAKYNLKTEVTGDIPFLRGLEQRANEYIAHNEEHAEERTEFASTSLEFKKWQNRCIGATETMEAIEGKTGLRLVENRKGLRVYPRKNLVLEYREASTVPNDDPQGGGRFKLERTAEKKPIKLPKEAVLTNIEFVPQYDKEDLAEDSDKTQTGTFQFTLQIEGVERDPMSVKEFLEWADGTGAHEKIAKVEDAKKAIAETTGIEMDIKPGLQLLDELEPENGEPRYRIIGIRDIVGGKVILEQPIIYTSENEKHTSDYFKDNDPRSELTIGELYRLIVKRNLVPLNDTRNPAEMLPKTPKPYAAYGYSGEKEETIELSQGGTLGDVYAKHGPAIFAGAAVAGQLPTKNQLDTFTAARTFKRGGYDGSGRHFTKTNIPGARYMAIQNKHDLEEEETLDSEDDLEELMSTHDKHKAPHKEPHAGEHDDLEEEAPGHEEPGHDAEGHDEHGHGIYEIKPPGKGDPHESNEVIPGTATGSVSETHTPHRGYLGKLWQESRFLAVDDIIGLGKSVYEHYERRWHRRSKEKFSTVGKGLPFSYGTEMSRIKQQAEDEEVHQNQEAMEHWGIDQIVEALKEAQNPDQLKACFEVLMKKGHIRWDDCHMWQALNKWVPDYLAIPIPENHNPYARDKNTNKTGFEYIEKAIDYLWGESTYQEWKEQNDSNFNHKVKENFEHGKQLEGDPKVDPEGKGGVDFELRRLLANHKNGDYVDPHAYEGLLHFIIEYGKGSGPETKLYYIIEGLTAENPKTHETIIPLERLSSINSEYCNAFPMLDYLTKKDVADPNSPNGKRPWTLADFKAWAKYWDEGSEPGKENMPNKRVSDHIWNYALTDRKTILRNNKGIRSAEKMDHDDAHIIIPLTDETTVARACQSTTGAKSYFTQEGYGNAFPGYNQYIKTLGERADKPKLIKAIRSFVIFESIMDSRYKKEDDKTYARLGGEVWKRGSVVDDWPAITHKKQLYGVIEATAQAYGNPKLLDIVAKMQEKTGSMEDKTEKQHQSQVQKALDEFGEEFEKTVRGDRCQKLLSVINNANLRGLEYSSTEEQKARYKEMAKDDELDE